MEFYEYNEVMEVIALKTFVVHQVEEFEIQEKMEVFKEEAVSDW